MCSICLLTRIFTIHSYRIIIIPDSICSRLNLPYSSLLSPSPNSLISTDSWSESNILFRIDKCRLTTIKKYCIIRIKNPKSKCLTFWRIANSTWKNSIYINIFIIGKRVIIRKLKISFFCWVSFPSYFVRILSYNFYSYFCYDRITLLQKIC